MAQLLYERSIANNQPISITSQNNLPVRLAVNSGSIELVEWLCELGANVRTHNDSAFRTACSKNMIKMVKWFTDRYADKYNGLYAVISENNVVDHAAAYDATVHCFIDLTRSGSLQYHRYDANQGVHINRVNAVLKSMNWARQSIIQSSFFNPMTKMTRIDHSVRKANQSTEMVRLTISGLEKIMKQIDDDITLDCRDQFKYLVYQESGHFGKHVDNVVTVDEITYDHPLIVYPPQDIEGGDFVIYDRKDPSISYKVSPSKYHWTIVIFPSKILHESLPVIKGQKETLKSDCRFIKNPKSHQQC
jgi:predicted 2-oxoglutarate/Fe(II)-dependent dioxygenase YbiX